MTIAEAMLAELDHEAATTRRFLERLPDDKLDWKPHEQSLGAGQLASHIATLPAQMSEMAMPDACPVPDMAGGFPQPASVAELLASHDAGIATTRTRLAGLDDARMAATWHMTANGHEFFAMPRAMMLRAFLFNHWYHHRGQLGVYLRMLGTKVPYAYGPSADEAPPEFAELMQAMGKGGG